ncbi:MAG TPA: ATP-dependent helicase [Candidatus Limnocylindria bacterium]|nr:ATP-dependent helicase [Candidatus Limnocylindria bacterium]
MNWLGDLNAQQRAAVEAGDGPLMIVAGPGTGKTKTLTARIVYLLSSGRAQPNQITALTFTNKAAREMRQRLTHLLFSRTGLENKGLPRVATFHALGYELLSANQKNPLKFATDEQRREIIKALPKPQDLKGLSTRELAAGISLFKTSLRPTPDDGMSRLVAGYNKVLARQGLHDFDDLLAQTYQLLSQDPAVRTSLAATCQHLLIDEFQDTNDLQYALMKLLQEGSKNVFVIGDPLQSIYGFRGASGGIFERFARDFPHGQSIALTTNYRSAPEIVSLSNAVFTDAPVLVPHQKVAGQVQAVRVLNEYSEAGWIIAEIENHLGGTTMLKGHDTDTAQQQTRQFSDYAVLYRTHRTARSLEQKLEESGIPYQIVGDDSPYEKPFIQTILQSLRYLAGGDVPVIKGLKEQQIKQLLADIPTVLLTETVHRIISKLGLDPPEEADRRILTQFMNSLVRFEGVTLADYLAQVEAIGEQGFYDPQAQAVTLLTIHAAKGLEFPHVFLIGAEEGLLPYLRTGKPTDVEEERRLFYVAVTRARQQLDILYAKNRGGQPAKPSRFIAALSPDVLPRITDPAMAAQQKRLHKKRLKRAQQTLL